MKKYYKSKKYIKYNRRHARKQKESWDRYKLFLRRKNAYIYKSEFVKKPENKKIQKSSEGYTTLTVPNNFSLIQNTEQTISFLHDLDKLYKLRKPVFVNLYNVSYLGYETIVILLATVIKFKNGHIKFNGNYPRNEESKKKLIQSGFFEVLYQEGYLYSSSIVGNGIYTHTNKYVDAKLGSQLIHKASNYIWEADRNCTGVQRTLIELMTNTNNHAGEIPGEKKWWVSINCAEGQDKSVVFSFVDFGKGIFNSLVKKKKWYQWVIDRREKETLTNPEIMELILKGQMHKTVTGQSHRGKGLPGIYESYDKNAFNNLYIISNDVFVNASENIYRELGINLNGTFVCWELSSANKNIVPKY